MNPCLPVTPPSEADATPNGVWAPNGEPVYGKAVKVDNSRPGPRPGETKEKPKICPE